MNRFENSPDLDQKQVTRSGKGPWLPRFGLAELMLAMVIFSVMAAAGSYLVRAHQDGRGRAVFVIFTLCAPIVLVLILSGYKQLQRWSRRSARRV